jgi:hypothetical protein
MTAPADHCPGCDDTWLWHDGHGCLRCDCTTTRPRPSPAGTDTTRDDEK